MILFLIIVAISYLDQNRVESFYPYRLCFLLNLLIIIGASLLAMTLHVCTE